MKYLISACLMGRNCKYNGGNNLSEELFRYMEDKDYVLVCPEVLGGLPVPRLSMEIKDGKVVNTKGEDMTDAFHHGAKLALALAKEEHIDLAITQSRSPSCGKGLRYSGDFDKKLVKGNGVFVDLLENNNISVIDIFDFIKKMQEKR